MLLPGVSKQPQRVPEQRACQEGSEHDSSKPGPANLCHSIMSGLYLAPSVAKVAALTLLVVHQHHAPDGPILFKFTFELLLCRLVADASHKEGVVRLTLQQCSTLVPGAMQEAAGVDIT